MKSTFPSLEVIFEQITKSRFTVVHVIFIPKALTFWRGEVVYIGSGLQLLAGREPVNPPEPTILLPCNLER